MGSIIVRIAAFACIWPLLGSCALGHITTSSNENHRTQAKFEQTSSDITKMEYSQAEWKEKLDSILTTQVFEFEIYDTSQPIDPGTGKAPLKAKGKITTSNQSISSEKTEKNNETAISDSIVTKEKGEIDAESHKTKKKAFGMGTFDILVSVLCILLLAYAVVSIKRKL